MLYFRRYFQLFLLVGAGGAIYPLLYLRQNFETPILEIFQIDTTQLGQYYQILGWMFFLGYLPSGWLADRVSSKILISMGLLLTGALGILFATVPPAQTLTWIFMGWGVATGFVFWSALLKGVKTLAKEREQGRFFGILDGGRGLVEAVLATIALIIYAKIVGDFGDSDNALSKVALQKVIYMYSSVCFIFAISIFMFLENTSQNNHETHKDKHSILQDIKTLLKIPEIWFVAGIIFCGYHLFWATYSFSAFLQVNYQVTTVTAGIITVAKLWTRPLGGIGGGFLGDKYSTIWILIAAMIVSSVALLIMAFLPQLRSIWFIFAIVLIVGTATYAIRGLYWAIFDKCGVSLTVTGLAIGFISLIGYLPDILIPYISNKIFAAYTDVTGYKIYFSYIAAVGLIGVILAYRLDRRLKKKQFLTRDDTTDSYISDAEAGSPHIPQVIR